jgi:flavodoxin
MDVTIIYFSQTGNTYKVASAMTEVFNNNNHHVRLNSLLDIRAETVTSGDLLGVGTPCFCSRAPQPVVQFINSVSSMKNQKVFIFATCGGAPGRVLSDLRYAFHRKGANVLAGHLFRGEVHHPAPTLNGRFPGRPNTEDLVLARRFARTVCEKVLKNQHENRLERNVPPIKPKWGFYEFLGWFISDSNLRLFLPEPKLDLLNCDLCGWCAQECPTQNISLAPHPVLGSTCIRCYRCYNSCSGKAFTANWRFGNLILWLLYNQALVRWFGDLTPGELIYNKRIANIRGV